MTLNILLIGFTFEALILHRTAVLLKSYNLYLFFKKYVGVNDAHSKWTLTEEKMLIIKLHY